LALAVPVVPSAAGGLTVSETIFTGRAGRRSITGILKNKSGRSYRGIQMWFSLIGPNGDNVGSAEARVDQLGGYKTARFEASAAEGLAKAAEIVLKQIEAQPNMR